MTYIIVLQGVVSIWLEPSWPRSVERLLLAQGKNSPQTLPKNLKQDRCIFIESLSSFSSSQATASGAATSDEGAVC